MNKRAQSISINTIIIAAIALAVLVILFLIFTGRLGLFSIGVQQTTNCMQACKAAGYNSNVLGPEVTDTSTVGSCSPNTELTGYYEITGGRKFKCCCSN